MLSSEFVAYWFLLLCSMPLYTFITRYLPFPPHCLWMLVSFQFCAIFGIVPPSTFLCMSSGKHVITFLLGTHPAVGLPGYMEGVGPSVMLLVVDFVYPFKEAVLGFVDICLLFFFIISILFISSLICSISFLLLTLCFVCLSLSNSFRW